MTEPGSDFTQGLARKPDNTAIKTDPHGGGPLLMAGAPLAKAGFAMVLLHGRGATAANSLGLGVELSVGRAAASIAFAAPQAAGNSWYPLSFMAPLGGNEPWLTSAIARVASTVQQLERSGIARSRIVIAGFSQGACLSAEFVARHPARYAAVLAFSGGLVGPQDHDLAHTGDLAGTPVLLSSGDPDPHVPWSRVVATGDQLQRMGAVVTATRYAGRPHTILPEEVTAARRMLSQVPGWAASGS